MVMLDYPNFYPIPSIVDAIIKPTPLGYLTLIECVFSNPESNNRKCIIQNIRGLQSHNSSSI